MIAQINPAILKLGQDIIREFSVDPEMGLTTAAWVKQEEGWELLLGLEIMTKPNYRSAYDKMADLFHDPKAPVSIISESTHALSHSAPILLKAKEYLNYPEDSAFIHEDDYGIHVADVYFVYRLEDEGRTGTSESAPIRH